MENETITIAEVLDGVPDVGSIACAAIFEAARMAVELTDLSEKYRAEKNKSEAVAEYHHACAVGAWRVVHTMIDIKVMK